MIKKIFIGVLIAAAFILLVLGAVNRTLAKTSDQTLLSSQEKVQENRAIKQATNQSKQLEKNIKNSITAGSSGNAGQNGGGNNANQSTDCENSGQNGQGNNTNPSASNGNSGQNGRGNITNQSTIDENSANNGHGNNSSGNNLEGGEANQVDWIDLDGEVTDIDSNLWIISLSDDSSIELEGRTLSFLLEQGFSASAGDQITLRGFYEDDLLKIGHIVNQNTGQEIELRAETGQPLWSGGYGGRN